MNISFRKSYSLMMSSEDAIIIGCFAGDLNQNAHFVEVDNETGGVLVARATHEKFAGKVGQVLVHYATTSRPATTFCRQYVLVGLGERSQLNVKSLRKALIAAFKEVKRLKVPSVLMAPICLVDTKISSYELGENIAAYAGMIDYTINHKKTAHSLKEAEVHVESLVVESALEDNSQLESGLANGAHIAAAVKLARDLSNEPAAICTPAYLQEVAQQIADHSEGLIVAEFLGQEELTALGAGGILAVNSGSPLPPVLGVLTYTPPGGPTKEVLGLEGKAITFDSGGLDLKPAAGMRHMKRDMSGAAVALATIQAIAALRLPLSVKVIFAATENMVDGRAYKPGDVLRMLSGITVEVDNTDAEGRVAGADAITYALRYLGVTMLGTVKTLTGAVKSIGGDVAAGLFSNNETVSRTVQAAAARAGEYVQPIEMFEELRELNHSQMADLKNSGGEMAGATTAAWFLREFVQDAPWFHLDIAGVAYRDRELGPDPRGATGYGVRTLIELARLLEQK